MFLLTGLLYLLIGFSPFLVLALHGSWGWAICCFLFLVIVEEQVTKYCFRKMGLNV